MNELVCRLCVFWYVDDFSFLCNILYQPDPGLDSFILKVCPSCIVVCVCSLVEMMFGLLFNHPIVVVHHEAISAHHVMFAALFRLLSRGIKFCKQPVIATLCHTVLKLYNRVL